MPDARPLPPEMGGAQPIGWLLLFAAILAALPTPQPEARLFSDGWGAQSFADPNICSTATEGRPTRVALFAKTPAVAQRLDQWSLAMQYVVSGLLLPAFALATAWSRRNGARAPLVFVLLGLAPAWFQWPLNPAFVDLRQGLAEVWMALWPLAESQFVWLDGLALSLWLIGGTLLAGGSGFLAVRLAARLAGIDWHRLAHALLPLVAVTIFLGLTQATALYLRGEGADLDWLPALRATLLALAVATSARLAVRHTMSGSGEPAHKIVALALWSVPLALTAAHGWAMYFHWTNRYHV